MISLISFTLLLYKWAVTVVIHSEARLWLLIADRDSIRLLTIFHLIIKFVDGLCSRHNFVASTRVVLLQLNNYKIAKNKWGIVEKTEIIAELFNHLAFPLRTLFWLWAEPGCLAELRKKPAVFRAAEVGCEICGTEKRGWCSVESQPQKVVQEAFQWVLPSNMLLIRQPPILGLTAAELWSKIE